MNHMSNDSVSPGPLNVAVLLINMDKFYHTFQLKTQRLQLIIQLHILH